MKTTVILIMAIFCLGATGFAQEKRDTIRQEPKTTGKEKVKMRNELGLTKTQGKVIKAEQKEFKAKRAELGRDTTLTAGQRKQKLRDLQTDHFQKIDSSLTPEQRIKMRELRKKKRSAS